MLDGGGNDHDISLRVAAGARYRGAEVRGIIIIDRDGRAARTQQRVVQEPHRIGLDNVFYRGVLPATASLLSDDEADAFPDSIAQRILNEDPQGKIHQCEANGQERKND